MYEVTKQNTNQPMAANAMIRFQAIFPEKANALTQLYYSTVTTEMIMNTSIISILYTLCLSVFLSVFLCEQRSDGAS